MLKKYNIDTWYINIIKLFQRYLHPLHHSLSENSSLHADSDVSSVNYAKKCITLTLGINFIKLFLRFFTFEGAK